MHEGFTYFIEESLGPQTLGDRFEEELDAVGRIFDDGFTAFMEVVERHADAQLSLPTRSASASELESVVGAHNAAKRLPDLAERILERSHRPGRRRLRDRRL